MKTLSSTLRAIAERSPDHPAVIEDGRALDYKSILSRIRQLTEFLANKGAGAGSRVAIVFPNDAWFASSFFAVAHLGAVVVPLNPALRESEMASIMKDAGVSVVLTQESLRERCYGALRSVAEAGEEAVVALDEAALNVSVNGATAWPEEAAPKPLRWPARKEV